MRTDSTQRDLWSAGCAETRTSGAGSGPRKPPGGNTGTASRVDFHHNFLHLPIGLDDALAEARSYRLSWALAHQHLGQLPKPMAAAIDANARNKVYFSLSPSDAHVLARHTLPHLDEDDLTSLDGYQIACRLMAGARPARPFTLTTLPPPPARPGALAAARKAARAHGLNAAARAEHHALRRHLTRTTPAWNDSQTLSGSDSSSSPSISLSTSLSVSPSPETGSEPDTPHALTVQVSPDLPDPGGSATDYTTRRRHP